MPALLVDCVESVEIEHHTVADADLSALNFTGGTIVAYPVFAPSYTLCCHVPSSWKATTSFNLYTTAGVMAKEKSPSAATDALSYTCDESIPNVNLSTPVY